jgi:phosphatidylserine/phosphatidylglycerophosphate/cardiolipin synthase-like enzyme
MENQYFRELEITVLIFLRYLLTELALAPIHGAVAVCHPGIMSPRWYRAPTRLNIAILRATTARILSLDTGAGVVPVARPAGGWPKVKITAPWLFGSYFWVEVSWPGGGAAGSMVRAAGGIACLTMVTPSPAGATAFTPIYLHSKFAVLDRSYNLGSTNIAERSFYSDSETDVEVPDPVETQRAMATFFPALTGGIGGPSLSTWVDQMATIAAANFDMEKGARPWAPIGLITEFPYE